MTWVDASYYSVSLLCTVGYCDIHASDDDSKIASIVLTLFGFLVVCVILAHISFIVLDTHDRDIRRIETETEIQIRANMEEHPGSLVKATSSPGTNVNSSEHEEDKKACCSPVMGSVLGRFVMSLAEYFVVLTFGTLLFCFEQDVSFLDGLYFAVRVYSFVILNPINTRHIHRYRQRPRSDSVMRR